jgi:hypothetical protein
MVSQELKVNPLKCLQNKIQLWERMENDFTLSTLTTQFSGMLRQSTTLAQPRNALGR